MEKLVEMVGENAEIRQGDVKVPVKVRSVNREENGHWTLDVTEAEKEHGPSWYARGWMGHVSTPGTFGLRVPTNSTKCAICGKRIEGSDGRLKNHIHNYEAMRAVKWIDVTRPVGDHEKWAHPKCLHAVRFDKAQWPAGLVFEETTGSQDQKRQDEAFKLLKEKGHDNFTAHRMVAWEKGREPAIVSELLDGEKLVPEVGDTVLAGGRTFLIEATAKRIGSGWCFSAKECAHGARCEFSGSLRDVTLLVRNGKGINKKYQP